MSTLTRIVATQPIRPSATCGFGFSHNLSIDLPVGRTRCAWKRKQAPVGPMMRVTMSNARLPCAGAPCRSPAHREPRRQVLQCHFYTAVERGRHNAPTSCVGAEFGVAQGAACSMAAQMRQGKTWTFNVLRRYRRDSAALSWPLSL